MTSEPSSGADAVASANAALHPPGVPECAGRDRSGFDCWRTRLLWLLGVLAAIVVVDQGTKIWAIETLQSTQFDPQIYLGGLLRIQYAENSGAFLSLMADWPPEVRFWVLTVINGVVLTGVFVFLTGTRTADRWMWFALLLILAGGIGNLIDRVRFHGLVIDFLNIGVGRVRTGIFNVADIAITAGFLMLVPRAFLPEKSCERSDSAPANRISAAATGPGSINTAPLKENAP